MKNLENKVIIITGAAMGLGFATAKELASKGANLTLVDYNEKSLENARDSQQKATERERARNGDTSHHREIRSHGPPCMKASLLHLRSA